MPNVGGHLVAAHEVLGSENPVFVLGTVLPDLTAIFNDHAPADAKVNVHGYDQHLDAGMAFHQKTDRIFNPQPDFVDAKTRLENLLAEQGIRPRAAKISSELLTKILVDCALLESEEDRRTILAAANLAREGLEQIKDAPASHRYFRYVGEYLGGNIEGRYSSPVLLANLAYRRLSNRAKNARRPLTDVQFRERTIHETEVDTFVEVLEHHSNTISALGLSAFRKTVAQLKAKTAEL